ncbi:MAG: CHAD domain-containing protein [Candidatus Omnitrophica bacterium]|nr:CHAD domain-containing protein [Candidatus Omnitrophota bacterium]
MDDQEFFKTIISGHVKAVEKEWAAVRKGTDMEALHRMRVALRRLKSALADLRDVLSRRELDPALNGIKALLSLLGYARDIDTKAGFLDAVASFDRSKPYAKGIGEIAEELHEDRAEVQPKIMKALDRAKREQLFRRISKLKPLLAEGDITLDEWARNRITVRLEKMLRWEPYVKKPRRERELHEMRIAAKNLRYTIENLSGLYGKKLTRYAEEAMKVQRSLGEVHNYDVWLKLLDVLRESAGRGNRFCEALRFLRKECEQARTAAFGEFVALWAELKARKLWLKLDQFSS